MSDVQTTGLEHDVAMLERVASIARELATARNVDETLQRVVDLGQNYVPGCEAASLSIIRDRVVSTPAWSHELSYDVDQAQYRTGEGPCLEAIVQHDTTILPDLEDETRWPRWRDAIAEHGVRSMISFRLAVAPDHDATIGALNMLSTHADAFGDESRLFGEVFASHAAIALRAAFTEAGLEQALATRELVTQAKGILMEREGLESRQAFDRLVALAEKRRSTLREVALQLADAAAGT